MTKTVGPVTGILFELTTRGEGTWWASTLEQAYQTASRRAHPVAIRVLYQSRVAQIRAGHVVAEFVVVQPKAKPVKPKASADVNALKGMIGAAL